MIRNILSLALLVVVAAAPAGADERPFTQGRLWRVENNDGAASWLVGTMHSADPAVATPWPALRRTMDSVDSVTVELVMDDAATATMGRAMVFDDGHTLGEIAGSKRMARIKAVGATYGMPVEALQQFRPWAVNMIFSTPPSELQRQASGQPMLDNVLRQYGESRGLQIYGIETVEEQIAIFADYSEQDQLALLDLTLDMQPEMQQQFDDLRRAWLAGDLGQLYDTAMQMPAGVDTTLVDDFVERLVNERNHRMARRIRPMLDQGNALIAVGALHLPGDDGLLALLQKEGYRVSPAE